MSKFFVGQRVRVVFADAMPETLGAEAVVTTTLFRAYDGEMVHGISINGRDTYCARPSSLSPITPEGAQPSEYTTLHDLLTSLEGVAA